MIVDNEYFIFRKLFWETENLNLDTYELILHKELNDRFLQELQFLLDINGLVYIKNATKNRQNSNYIGNNTKAILYDTNITFVCNNFKNPELDETDINYEHKSYLNMIYAEFVQFPYSRFSLDKKLKKKLKKNIYYEWIRSSFDKNNKHFITACQNGEIIGYILYREDESNYVIELIAVKQKYQHKKIGSQLINVLKKEASNNHISIIIVGTQVSNITGINFYIKNGFSIKETTDIYHWWK
jgi:ribosomal protein S18 acetylase RimI-like enzyme